MSATNDQSEDGILVPGAVALEAAQGTLAAQASQASRELRLRTARREITERRRIIHRLRQALGSGGFVLHYQPLVSLKSGMIRGAEAIIRLQHSRRGLIPANHFMPVAERSDVINDVGGWMLQTACMEAGAWPACISVALTLSLRHLQSGRLIRQLLEALSRSGMAPERLELELTEAMLIDDNEDTAFSLKALQGIGVRMALNNFGIGYASLSALKRLPLATLRLDRSLIQNLGEGQADLAIVHAAIEAGHALGCAVLADGVESEQQFKLLSQIGCDEGQGTYFSQAVAAAEMAAIVGSR
jgi:EAL domain-containing protein (putative c-di-GMP-specific phosphodiesterase class I)